MLVIAFHLEEFCSLSLDKPQDNRQANFLKNIPNIITINIPSIYDIVIVLLSLDVNILKSNKLKYKINDMHNNAIYIIYTGLNPVYFL